MAGKCLDSPTKQPERREGTLRQYDGRRLVTEYKVDNSLDAWWDYAVTTRASTVYGPCNSHRKQG